MYKNKNTKKNNNLKKLWITTNIVYTTSNKEIKCDKMIK
jgi:hypothetical protein